MNDASNTAAALFRAHDKRRTHNTRHPFYISAKHVRRIPTLCDTTDTKNAAGRSTAMHMQRLDTLDRRKLKDMVWAQQYKLWRTIPEGSTHAKDKYVHPLHKVHCPLDPPPLRHLPRYTHLDTPAAATTRTRLRLGRAGLRVDQKRTGWPVPSVTCRVCDNADETVEHVLQHCSAPAAVSLRAQVVRRLVRLCDKAGMPADSVHRLRLTSTLTSKMMLHPWIATPYERWLKKIHTITGMYITRICRLWDC